MRKIKKWILKGIAFIFTIFLTLKYVLGSIFIIILGKLPLKVTETFKRSIFLICEKKIV